MDEKRVLEAIAQLEAAGEGITTRAVQRITRGSMRDVAYYVAEWRSGRLLPQSDFDRLETHIDDLRARIADDRALRRQHTHMKELVGLVLQMARYLANHPPPKEIHHTHPVRLMTRQERAEHNQAQWQSMRAIQALLRGRY